MLAVVFLCEDFTRALTWQIKKSTAIPLWRNHSVN